MQNKPVVLVDFIISTFTVLVVLAFAIYLLAVFVYLAMVYASLYTSEPKQAD